MSDAVRESVDTGRHSPPLKVIVFPGGFNWPIWVAQDQGLLAREGISVQLTPTPNSTFQLKGLIEGDFDIAMTAVDNVVAYREGQGEAGVDGADIVAVMGSDPGFLRLVTAPDVHRYADLRGKTLSVDALTTGYAFVLLEMLQRNGLELDRDYRAERAGGVMQRYQALIEGKHAGTLLVSPFDLMAQARGCHVLCRAPELLGHYQGVVGAVRRSWARANARPLIGYIRALGTAVEWLYQAENKADALRIFLTHMPQGTTAQAAEVAHAALLNPAEGFQRRARIDLEGVRTVTRLRAKYAATSRQIGAPEDYYDPAFYTAAFD